MMCVPIARIVATEAGHVTLDLDLPADLPCFHGHFPGFPVLAGVVQIDWVMQLGVTHLGCAEPVASDFRIKFKRVIMPGNPLTLTLDLNTARRRLDFVYRTGTRVASQGHVMLATS
jgi:3-hydroxymyristoyl/3-hydroxydecanoyl-(acyl carrier protein) dehydratase